MIPALKKRIVCCDLEALYQYPGACSPSGHAGVPCKPEDRHNQGHAGKWAISRGKLDEKGHALLHYLLSGPQLAMLQTAATLLVQTEDKR